jgi:hypothetical protein
MVTRSRSHVPAAALDAGALDAGVLDAGVLDAVPVAMELVARSLETKVDILVRSINDMKERMADTRECPICFEQAPPNQIVVWNGCGHMFCAPCARKHLSQAGLRTRIPSFLVRVIQVEMGDRNCPICRRHPTDCLNSGDRVRPADPIVYKMLGVQESHTLLGRELNCGCGSDHHCTSTSTATQLTHFLNCPNTTVACPMSDACEPFPTGGTYKQLLANLTLHFKTHCHYQARCPHFGCRFQGTLRAMAEHLREHLDARLVEIYAETLKNCLLNQRGFVGFPAGRPMQEVIMPWAQLNRKEIIRELPWWLDTFEISSGSPLLLPSDAAENVDDAA